MIIINNTLTYILSLSHTHTHIHMHERAQTMGREGPGGGALDMLVGTPNINAAKNGKTSWSYVICYAVRFDVNCNVI